MSLSMTCGHVPRYMITKLYSRDSIALSLASFEGSMTGIFACSYRSGKNCICIMVTVVRLDRKER